jgi:ribosomal protein S18 acetylase RimI-like enzyme
MILLLRYDSKKHSYKNPLTNISSGIRFVASPEITNRLYVIPVEQGKDVVPPTGTLEKASVFYLLLSVDDTNDESDENDLSSFCSECKNISGTLTLLAKFSLETKKFTKFDQQQQKVTTFQDETQEENEDEDEESSCCFFCKNFKNGKTLAYSCFAFATSANASVTTTPIPEAYLVSVTVAKDFRNQKLCSSLLKESFIDLQNFNDRKDIFLKRIRLHVRSDLPFLKKMYENFGFVVRRNCPKYYPDAKLDAVEMLLEGFDKKIFEEKESGVRRER